MNITREEVLAVAKLARLQFDDQRATALTFELSKIITYMQKLDELDTTDVEPTAQVTVSEAPLRPDLPAEGLAKSVVFEQAPRVDSMAFLVPGFVDES